MRNFLLQILLIATLSPAQGLSLSVIELTQDKVSRFGIVIDLIQSQETDRSASRSEFVTADFSAFSRCAVDQVVISAFDEMGNAVFSSIVGDSEGLYYFQVRDDFLPTTEIYIDCQPTGSGYIPKKYSFNLGAAVEAI